MKSETYLSAKILDDDSARVDIKGSAKEILVLLEVATVDIFTELKDSGYPDSLELMCLFFKNVAKEVAGNGNAQISD